MTFVLIVLGGDVVMLVMAYMIGASEERPREHVERARRERARRRKPAGPELSDWRRFKANLRQRYGR